MDYFQQRYLEQDRAFVGTSGLDTIDLPNKGLLSCLQLNVRATAGATCGKRDIKPIDALERLELIVNGSQVVKSLSGRQVRALMHYQKMKQPEAFTSNWASQSSRIELFINLGRHFHDMDYMLDLGQVNDPELRITYDFTKTGEVGWTNGEAFTSPYRDTVCHLLRESSVVPEGYIKTSELYRFTNPVSKKENMTIPRGPVYSNLYLQSFYRDSGLAFTLDEIEVNIDNGRVIPLRLAMPEFMDVVAAKYGTVFARELVDYSPHTEFPLVPPIENGKLVPFLWGEADAMHVNTAAVWGNMAWFLCLDESAAESHTCTKWMIDWEGLFPYSLAAIPIFDPWDKRFWIDSSVLGDFHVRFEGLATGSASCVVKLLADEVVTKYP